MSKNHAREEDKIDVKDALKSLKRPGSISLGALKKELREKELERQRRKAAGYVFIRLPIKKHRSLIDWLYRGRRRGEPRYKTVRRNLYEAMNRDLGRQ
jgi:hypothetical protein